MQYKTRLSLFKNQRRLPRFAIEKCACRVRFFAICKRNFASFRFYLIGGFLYFDAKFWFVCLFAQVSCNWWAQQFASMDNITTKDTHSLLGGKSFNWRAMYLAYAVVMFAVVTVGFLGNVLTLIILHYREHRKKVLTPLMINLAVGDILMVIVVYPVVIASNLVGKQLKEESLRCKWSAFANGAIGITTIATLVVMSGVMYHGIKQTLPKPKIHAKNMSLLVLSTWLYGILLNLPPVIGWTRAVPGEAGISCAPEWTSSEPESVAYIAFLLVFGFFLPLTVIGTFHYMIYRYVCIN